MVGGRQVITPARRADAPYRAEPDGLRLPRMRRESSNELSTMFSLEDA